MMEPDDLDDDAPTQIYTLPSAAVLARTAVTNGDALWDANDVARFLRVSRSWVYHRAEAGPLPHVRVGGLLRFDTALIRESVRTK
jgi:excisionase family DNA binding protein